MWKNSSNICLKRSDVSFKNEERYASGMKLCGNSESLVVVPENDPCPLVNITEDVPSLDEHYRLLVDADNILESYYGTFNATSPYTFEAYPISKMAVS